MIQKNVKAWLQRRKYLRFRQAAILVQKRARGWLVRRMVEGMRRTNAATVIQKWYRCHHTQQYYQQLRRGVMFLQRRARGHLGRMRYRQAVMDHKATIIQSRIRGWLARVEYHRVLRKVVKVQSRVRRWLAIKELKRLKVGGGLWVGHWWAELCGWGTGGQNGMKAGSKVIGQPICMYVSAQAEARSLDHIQRLNKGLENKIIELQQKLMQQVSAALRLCMGVSQCSRVCL